MINTTESKQDETEDEIQPGLCPICHQPNKCAVLAGEDPYSCWCMTTKVPEALLAKVPEKHRGKSCVCKKCVEAFEG